MKNESLAVARHRLVVLTRTTIPTDPRRRSGRARFDDFSVAKVPLLRSFRRGCYGPPARRDVLSISSDSPGVHRHPSARPELNVRMAGPCSPTHALNPPERAELTSAIQAGFQADGRPWRCWRRGLF